jgi:hypothetical protein
MLAHFYKLRSSRRSASIRRVKRIRAVQQIICWFIRRDIPDGLYENFISLIELLINRAEEYKFRAAFRLSRHVFEALVIDLAPFIRDGNSRNASQNVSARHKIGIALYYMAHGMDGDVLGGAAGLEKPTALKYLHEVVFAICTEISKRWIGEGILNQPNYIENIRARFHARRGVPMVGLALDGSMIPYKPRDGERKQDFQNYKSWTSLNVIAIVNSAHIFVDMDVAWPGRSHDKSCADASSFMMAMAEHPIPWLGEHGLVLADSAWGVGTDIIMTPYTAAQGGTVDKQWYNFVHSATRFPCEEAFGRWKNRFRCLLKGPDFSQVHAKRIIFATAVLHNMCTICNDLDPSYFDGSDGSAAGFPASPLSVYDESYPIDRIVCPRCKKRSNGAMPSVHGQTGCGCFTENTMDRLDPMYLIQNPDVLQNMTSPDPVVRKQAYCDVLFLTKPVNF